MFKRKKKTGCETPEFRKFTLPPDPIFGWQPKKSLDTNPPNKGSNVVKPNPNYIPPASVKNTCNYTTPCGWCTKWDKKCDKKISGGNDVEPRKKKDATLEYIKSGKGMPQF